MDTYYDLVTEMSFHRGRIHRIPGHSKFNDSYSHSPKNFKLTTEEKKKLDEYTTPKQSVGLGLK
jgi:hypothetical protein